MNVEAVAEAAVWAVDHARSGAGPVFLDCRCYRFVGHNTGEHTLGVNYRTIQEIDDWKLKDPLISTALRLVEHHALSKEDIDAIDESVSKELASATDFARQSPHPSPASAMDFMYATPTLTTATRWGSQ